MQERKISFTEYRYPFVKKYYLIAMIVFLFLTIGLSACSTDQASEAASTKTVVSQSDLEAQYGLRVNLVAVTAAGGLVDVRFKIVDAKKASSLLQDAKNYPALWIADNGTTLNAPEDTKAQEINYINDGNLFIMYPNAGSSVKPGTPVTIVFGEIQVDPITAR